MSTANRSNPPRSDGLRDRLNAAHGGLLRVHKSLLDHERARYEQSRGPVGGAVQFLQVVLHDPWFAWLRPVSELTVQIDEFTSSKEPTDPRAGEALLAQAKALLVPAEEGDEFQRKYFRAIQQSPEVAAVHGEWRHAIDARLA